jgi:hypothetical protein
MLRGDEVVRGDAGGDPRFELESCADMGTKVFGFVTSVGEDFEERVRPGADRVRELGEE